MQPVLRAPIRFVAESGEPVHAPVVLATIGAIHTRLVLDTGSDVHLVTRELAEAAGLALAGADVGTDHAGTELDDPPAMLGQDALRGTVVAVGPDPATPVLWQVAQLAQGASKWAPTI